MPHRKRNICDSCGLERRDAAPGMLYKSIRIEQKVDVEKMTVEGIASTFEEPENHDSHGDIIDRHAFDWTILTHGPAGEDIIKMMWQHWHAMGVAVSLVVKDDGLHFKGRAAPTETNKERLILIDDRAVDSLSIGYRTIASEDMEVRTPWGWFVRKILKLRLYEVSPVNFGSNPNARISKNFDEQMIETRSGILVKASERCTCDLCDREADKPKAGRVISKKNEKALRSALADLDSAKTKIAALIADLDEEEDEEEDDDTKGAPVPPDDTEAEAALAGVIDVASELIKKLERPRPRTNQGE